MSGFCKDCRFWFCEDDYTRGWGDCLLLSSGERHEALVFDHGVNAMPGHMPEPLGVVIGGPGATYEHFYCSADFGCVQFEEKKRVIS